jgi:hypothetical protein
MIILLELERPAAAVGGLDARTRLTIEETHL